ncbi:MAG: phosphopantetheinyl transferase (holo-ACP synthase), partial [Flavobacteriales bacterium]
MIGIDLIAYNLAASSRWKEERFKEKVLCKSEMELVQEAWDTFLKFWEFWSAKEAAFKSESQAYPKNKFHPKHYTCLPNNQVISSISGRTLNYQTNYFPSYLTSKVTSNECDTTSRSFEIHNPLSPSQISAAVRHEAKKELQKHWGLELGMDQQLSYGKLDSASDKCLYLSMSHHGDYGAFAIAHKKEQAHV